jgi:IclR family transcriptional regulator, pca regulon regulatory protein
MGRLNAQDAAARAARTLPPGVEPGDFSEALARGLRVLQAFDASHRRMTIADVARAVDLPRATVRRTVTTLVHLGYLTQDGRLHELTPRVLRLATAYLSSNTGSAVLQPLCERLCAAVGESVSVAVLDGDDAVMIARAVPNQLINVGFGVGYRVPALHSALGRVLLAALDDDAFEAFLAAARPTAVTPRSVTDKDALRRLVHQVRDDGFAYVDREAESGFQSVAVPLHRWDGVTVAALNIGAGTDRVEKATMLGPMLTSLREAVEDLRGQLL